MKERLKKIFNIRWEVEFFKKLSAIVADFRLSERIIFFGLGGLLLVSGIVIVEEVNRALMVNVPADGGSMTEGIVGSPRFINPVLAVSDVDQDLTELVYSGLMKVNPDGTLSPDLAESYTISQNGLEYTFLLRENAHFSDGEKVTADDIEFTIGKIQDSAIKSPKRPAFYDVRVDVIDTKTVKFTLKQPYAYFLENLTVGILPKRLWNNLSTEEFGLSQYNVQPIGSGPYTIHAMQTLQKNMLIIPTYYELVPNASYASGAPFIGKLILRFYHDEQTLVNAYKHGDIQAMNSIDPADAENIAKQAGTVIETTTLPRLFAVFFNQNQSEVLAQKEVRTALDMAVDRNQIVQAVLDGYGKAIDGPIPAGFTPGTTSAAEMQDIDGALAVLAKAGWKKNAASGFLEKQVSKKKTLELDVDITTLNSPDLVKTANLIRDDWQKLGARVNVKPFELGDLEQNVIRPRKFDALLYGIVTGRDMDFFAFWHSSQRNDPGLNIAMYANPKVDKVLDDARKTANAAQQMIDYQTFASEIKKDVPAVFLYSPDFIYVVPEKLKGVSLGTITLPFERFLGIGSWYIETNNLWKIFQ